MCNNRPTIPDVALYAQTHPDCNHLCNKDIQKKLHHINTAIAYLRNARRYSTAIPQRQRRTQGGGISQGNTVNFA